MMRGKVRPKLRQVISFRAEMVVNHIEHYRQPNAMSGINQSLQPFRTAVIGLHCVRRRAVVSPVTSARAGRDRHDLNHSDAEFL